MQTKQITLELDGKWVLAHRDDRKLPINAFIELVSQAFDGKIEVANTSLTECTVYINDCMIDNDGLDEKIHSILSEGLNITDKDGVAQLLINDYTAPASAQEKDTESDPEIKSGDAESIGDMVRGFSEADAASETTVEDTADVTKSTEDIIHGLIGAEEFVKLASEVKNIAPQIILHQTFETFSFRSYLFSINDGCGLTTYLNLFADLLEENKLFNFGQKKRVIEVKLLPPVNDKNDPFEEAASYVKGYKRNDGMLLSIDISEWMPYIKDRRFKSFLSFLEDHSGENIIVFRIPFVEGDVLEDIGEALRDIMFIRTVAFPPMSTEELTECAKRFLQKLGFTAADDAWDVFGARITEEKSDGRFYGLNTVNKVVREMVYYKQLNNALCGADDTVIRAEEIVHMSKTYSKAAATAERKLAELVGMESVKASVEEIISQIEMSRKNKNLSTPSIHMRFVGSPGTGKTTVARIVGMMLTERGVLRVGNFFEYSGRDFCGRYIGETAPKTAAMCRDAYGSVLFIDEAYSLYRGDDNGRDFGREALDTLISEMENHRDDLVVIMAGYTDEMEMLMRGNVGLESRMPYIIEFPNYSREQLCTIFFKMVGDGFAYDEDFRADVKNYFDAITDEAISSKDFSNARFVRNLFERTCAKSAMRKQYDAEGRFVLSKDDFKLASSERVYQALITKKTKSTIGF